MWNVLGLYSRFRTASRAIERVGRVRRFSKALHHAREHEMHDQTGDQQKTDDAENPFCVGIALFVTRAGPARSALGFCARVWHRQKQIASRDPSPVAAAPISIARGN